MTQPSHPYTVQSFKAKLKDMGTKVKVARMNRGMTQSELAELIDISSKTVSAIEVGRVEASISQLQAIAAVLEEPIGYFVGERDSSVESKIERVTQELEEIRTLMQLSEAKKKLRG